jgi:DNA-binding transcriptional regulator LsrR (DeoR family)
MVSMSALEFKKLQDFSKLVEVSRMYWEKGIHQQIIADKIGISQGEVSRLVKKAREDGIVKITISPQFKHNLSEELKAKFNFLEDVFIDYTSTADVEKDMLEVLGYAGAKYLMDKIKHTDRIGLSCGQTLNALVKNIDNAIKVLKVTPKEQCRIYALVHPCIEKIVDPTPSSLVATMVRQLPKSIGYAYQFPVPKGESKDSYSIERYKSHPDILEMQEKMKKLQYYVVGIGYIDYSPDRSFVSGAGLAFNKLVSLLDLSDRLNKLDAVGECDHQPFNSEGKFLIEDPELKPLRDHMIYLPLDVLKQHVENKTATVMAIGGGGAKHNSIYAALKAKFFNHLITDSLTAWKILDLKRKEDRQLARQSGA